MKYGLGDTVENFVLRNSNREKRKLYDAVDGNKVMIVFFRGFWWPFCRQQLAALADHYDTLQALGTEVWGISVDNPDELEKLREQEDLPFELLSDRDKALISEWDIVNEKERDGIAFPNVYIIDQEREIILHSRDKTASRAEPEPLVDFLKKHDKDSSHRKEIADPDKSFQWPSLSSLIWGIPRKLGWMESWFFD